MTEVEELRLESTLAKAMRELRRVFASMGDFAILSAAARRKINTAATLPDRFLEAAAALIDAFPDFGRASRITGGEIRESIVSSWTDDGVADELELLAKGMRDTVAARRANIGRRVLLAYALAKRAEGGEELAACLDAMRRTLRRK